MERDPGEVVSRAEKHSPFLREMLRRHADLARILADNPSQMALSAVRVDEQVPLRRRLRHERERTALCLAIGDLSGELSLEDVSRTLSDLADASLDQAIAGAMAVLLPGAGTHGFCSLALGKHGSRELNYSSDIDPIMIFDPVTLPHGPRSDAGETAVRIARDVVDLLQTRDADGYVFRVDLRLRPAAEVTPIALSVNAAITHYESSALAWERMAFIRARSAAGDVMLGERMLKAIEPFVWRRGLDFGAVEELRRMSAAVRQHYASGQELGPGFNLKQGKGGIREVEFYVQVHQLIHGGRASDLRAPAILDALSRLVDRGIFDASTGRTLSDAYRTLRTIEHRLQMVDDRQTHSLPESSDGLDNVAQLHGLQSGNDLLFLLGPHVEAVGRLYDALIADRATRQPPPSLPVDGFSNSPRVERLIAGWRSGQVRAIRSAAARDAFERVLPDLLINLAAAPDPDAALLAFDAMVRGLASGINLFRLLEARPALMKRLTAVITHAEPLAQALARSPTLLDRLIDDSAFDEIGGIATLVEEMTVSGALLEEKLDFVRHVTTELKFILGVQLIECATTPEQAGLGYARIAEAAVKVVARAVSDDFRTRNGKVPGSELIIVALGRLGGRSLTNASDLDLVFLFTGDHLAISDGERSLGASLYFNRLAQRVCAGLSVATAAGPLYEVDTRLRPSGVKGPLAITTTSFLKYQEQEAWTWEHMALTRARPIFGSAKQTVVLARGIDAILSKTRDRETLAREIVKMRGEVARHKPPLGALDLKLGEGGLVDMEFTVHFEQLSGGVAIDPELPKAIDALVDKGRAPVALRAAHDLLNAVIIVMRLISPSMQAPGLPSRGVVAAACGATSWNDLLARIAVARQCVNAQWNSVRQLAEHS